jgi:hypothetical protein
LEREAKTMTEVIAFGNKLPSIPIIWIKRCHREDIERRPSGSQLSDICLKNFAIPRVEISPG